MRKVSADVIYTNKGAPREETVIVVDDDGQIADITELALHDPLTVEVFRGAIIPGFVNAHCHLELSHMVGLVETGTGLLPFLQKVVQMRDIDQSLIDRAIIQADQEMYNSGIVAVGDISNQIDTFATKRSSRIRYYTFVEMFDFLQDDQADSFYSRYKKVLDQAPEDLTNKRNAVPHAPYSVSPTLFAHIKNLQKPGTSITIHNQETPAEDELFRTGKGDFLGFYNNFGFSLDRFQATGKSSLYYTLSHLNSDQRTLLVHNTLTSGQDIEMAQEWSDAIYWVTCPSANLYIENRLPNYLNFINREAKVCVGTDSLTSNWKLSIWEELKTIYKYQSYVPIETLIKWATVNGARALGFEDTVGTIEVGKSPGLNLLSIDHEGQIDMTGTCLRLL
ncbi:MAG: amidohydrolase family protein [Saprospiraceae bacterium]|nr:amidohydrolase family protein [Saprospiraceae bacterium]